MSERDGLLVSTDWLADNLSLPDLVILDGSLFLPNEGRDPHKEYRHTHIPGALFFDIEDLSDETSDLPHMLPSPVKFSSRMRKMGIGDGKRIVAYDSKGMFSAARVWWMFRVMGHKDIAVLDGGLPKWVAEKRPVTDEIQATQERHFTARRNAALVRDVDDIKAIVSGPNADGIQIIDARAAERFAGTAPEPRPGLRAGHMPGARNIPYGSLLNADLTMKSTADLRKIFADAGIDLGKPAVTSCGSGVTAAVISLALELVGHRDHALYDGSWVEWGGNEDHPVATGT